MSREYRMWMDKIYLKFNMLQITLFVIRCLRFDSPILHHSLSDIRYSLFKNFLPKNRKISNKNTHYPLPTTYYLLPTTPYYLLLTTYYLLRNEHVIRI
jgi:hypothetical protein